VWGLDPLARLAIGRSVAGPGLDPNGKPHLLYWSQKVALNIDSERLQWRDIEGVEAFARPFRKLADGWKKSGKGFPGAGCSNQQCAFAAT
jgi:hypothetical protein